MPSVPDKTTIVFCTFRQSGHHHWPDAPDKYRYLRFDHRHEFHVRVEVAVRHDDRDVEFIALKERAHEAFKRLGWVQKEGHLQLDTCSCESLANLLYQNLTDRDNDFDPYHITAIEVSEDGENGARVTFA